MRRPKKLQNNCGDFFKFLWPLQKTWTLVRTYTFSTFLCIIPITSSTWACCCPILRAAWICLICSGPGMGLPSGPRGLSFFSGSAPPAAPPGAGAPAAGGPGFGAGAAIVTDRVQRQAYDMQQSYIYQVL